MKPLISIIIPVYNQENYIKQCLDSILSQSFKDFEIIIVDDESKDNTISIINKYNDDRITVYHKNNEGVSKARSFGLNKANGDYVLFIDSDDYLINDEVLNNLSKNINKTDVIRFGSIYLKNNKLINEDMNNYLDEYLCGEYFVEHILTLNKRYSWYLWQYLFKKELWNGISFPEGKIFEDSYTIYQVLLKAKKIKVIKDNYYVYRYNDSSLSKRVNLKICLDMIDVIKESTNNINNLKLNPNLKKLLLNNFSYGYITDVDVLYLLDKASRSILNIKLINNINLIDYLVYGKEVMIKNCVKLIGIDKTSKLLNIRRSIWKKQK